MQTTPPTADKLAVQQLLDAYDAANIGACNYWACPGPNTNRPTPMATCSKCYAAIMLRRALKRMGILPKEGTNEGS